MSIPVNEMKVKAMAPWFGETLVFVPHYCFDCQMIWYAKARLEVCVRCGSQNIVNCFRERLTMTDAERIKRLLNWITDPIKCWKCSQEIWFIKTKSVTLMPVTGDGESHFSNCPAAAEFRKKKGRSEAECQRN